MKIMPETHQSIILPSGIHVVIDLSWKNLRFLLISSALLTVTMFYRSFHFTQTVTTELPLFPQFINLSSLVSFHVAEVVVISHTEKKARFQYTEAQLHRLDLNFSRFPAIDFHFGDPNRGRETQRLLHPDTRFDLNYTRHLVAKKDQWTQINSWQSHLQVYFHYVDAIFPQGPLVILEDDIFLKPAFLYSLNPSFYNTLPLDWEVLFLDRSTLSCNDTKKSSLERWGDWMFRSYTPDCCVVQSINETSAYIIRSPSVARKLILHSNKIHQESATSFWNLEILPNRIINAYSVTVSRSSSKKSRASLHLILKRMSRLYDATQKHSGDFSSNFYLRRNGGILKGFDDVNDD